MISSDRIVKFGKVVLMALAEAAAMEYVRHNNTTIPIPKIHFTFCYGDWGYIITDFIDAETFDNVQFHY